MANHIQNKVNNVLLTRMPEPPLAGHWRMKANFRIQAPIERVKPECSGPNSQLVKLTARYCISNVICDSKWVNWFTWEVHDKLEAVLERQTACLPANPRHGIQYHERYSDLYRLRFQKAPDQYRIANCIATVFPSRTEVISLKGWYKRQYPAEPQFRLDM